ncbi:MAG: tRNA 2-thiocytidine biosynthesis protein TtcA [Firmicutes bacterium]|mgnify:CR=1 FL=1|nr:tRNA 2-thiocytidine biosynthesis protein TtcA [Bacillota bacterium]
MRLPKWVLRRFYRAIVEFKLLEPDDRVLVGLSGGKDSSFLLASLKLLQEHMPFSFTVAALHIDQGFPDAVDLSPLKKFCTELDVPLTILSTSIYQMAFTDTGEKPCARCAYFRRGFIHNFAREHKYNKVAFAHHLDDAVETFLMSQLYAGQLKTFQPKSYLSRTGVTIIRPLIYFREKEIKQAQKFLSYEPINTPCPYAEHSMRAEVKALIQGLERKNDRIFDNLVAAMRGGSEQNFWPAPLSKEEFKVLMSDFWHEKRRIGGKEHDIQGTCSS